jgi:hypothetical protein
MQFIYSLQTASRYARSSTKLIIPIFVGPIRLWSTSTQPNIKPNKNFLYDVIGVSNNFTSTELQQKYHELSKKYHPDVNKGRTIKFLEITKAYNILKDFHNRKNYENMTDKEFKTFLGLWDIEYDPNKEAHLDLEDKYKADIEKQKSQEYGYIPILINKIVGIATECIGHHVSVEEVKEKNRQSNEEKKRKLLEDQEDIPIKKTRKISGITHIHFMLDVSGSMYAEVDGKSLMDICIDNITQILNNDILNIKKTSMTVFAEIPNSVMFNVQRQELIKGLTNRKYLELTRNNGTVMYDALNKYIDHEAQHSHNMYVILTDGQDTSKITTLKELCTNIKKKNNVNIIIIKINHPEESSDRKDLRQIIESAKFGKLLKVGDKLELPSEAQIIETFMDATNELLDIQNNPYSTKINTQSITPNTIDNLVSQFGFQLQISKS